MRCSPDSRAVRRVDPPVALLRGWSGGRPWRRALVALLVVLTVLVGGRLPDQAHAAAAGRALIATPPAMGAWLGLPPAPIAPASSVVSVWTGGQMLVFGRAQPAPPWSIDVAAAYNPTTRTWQRLAPFPGPKGNYEGRYWAVWTGREMLVVGPGDRQAYDPATNRWRRLPRAAGVPLGIVVWTGRELIGWGGGCCGDASAAGSAYNPTTNAGRVVARSPLAPEQRPIGAWTGHELVVVVSGINPADGRPWPARLARAATYDPVTDTWRRIAQLPAMRTNANAVWDGREVLVVGGIGPPRGGNQPAPAPIGFAYDPEANRWRRLPRMAGRTGAAAVWTGTRLLVWGGTTSPPASRKLVTPRQGLAFDPKANRWSSLPRAPIPGRLDPAAVWTGDAMIVWGGHRPASPAGSGSTAFADGAVFRPAKA